MTQPSAAGPMGAEAQWRAFLADGRFMIQRDPASGTHVFQPRAYAPGTGAALEWVEAGGGGTVYATTVNRRRPEKGGDVHICIVELDEGPRLMSRVVGMDPHEVKVGLRVRAKVDQINGEPAVTFEAEGGA